MEDSAEVLAGEENEVKELDAAQEARVKSLMEIGAFYGLSKSRTNPKMKPYILTTKSGVEVIDLEKTMEAIDKSLESLKNKAKSGGSILFVGTTPSAKIAVSRIAEELKMPYVTERWLGGTLTNFKVISQRIAQMKKVKGDKESGNLEKYTKKERAEIMKELERMEKFFHGLFYMERIPAAIVIFDVRNNTLAAHEAEKVGIVSFGTVNTNANPDLVSFSIPINDKAVSVIDYLAEEMGKAIKEGQKEYESSIVKQEENNNKQNG